MFRIGQTPENEIFALVRTNSAPILDAIERGVKADRLVQKKLIGFEELTLPDAEFAFKISHLGVKDRAAIIQLTKCGRLIKIYIESDHKGVSGGGYEFKFYPTALLRTTPLDEIEEFSRSQLFVFAYILIKYASEGEFVIYHDKKKLGTDNPAVALYEAYINADMRSTVLTCSERGVYENTKRKIYISKDTGIAQISGGGVTSMDITLTGIFADMMNPPLTVEYIKHDNKNHHFKLNERC